MISQLLAGGVEVANPVRDRGIDLIAYLDLADNLNDFVACPIQLKANKQARFCIEKKYEKITNLVMVYAWNVLSPKPELYALTYREVVDLLEVKGHTKTPSWTKDGGGYSLTVTDSWRETLSRFRMEPDMWKDTIVRVSKTGRTKDVTS